MTTMSAKRYAIATGLVFLFIVIFDMIFHGVYLKSIYEQTADLWRPEEVMKNYMAWLTLGQFIIALSFVSLYVYAFKQRNIVNGAVYGLLLAIIFIGNLFIWYAVAPYSTELFINWMIGTLIQVILAGVIVGFICKTSTT